MSYNEYLSDEEQDLLNAVYQYKEYSSENEYSASIVKLELEHYKRDLRFLRWLKSQVEETKK